MRGKESQRVEAALLATLDSNLTSLAEMVANQQVQFLSVKEHCGRKFILLFKKRFVMSFTEIQIGNGRVSALL